MKSIPRSSMGWLLLIPFLMVGCKCSQSPTVPEAPPPIPEEAPSIPQEAPPMDGAPSQQPPADDEAVPPDQQPPADDQAVPPGQQQEDQNSQPDNGGSHTPPGP